MPRYFVRSCPVRSDSWWMDDQPLLPDLTVSDHKATDTGLVDLDGQPIMRAPNPMGFGKDDEW